MRVKGTAFLARRAMLEQDLGAERFGEWLQKWLAAHEEFPSPILATSWIPWEVFARFNDDVLRDFYAGDEQSYWRFGRKSAEWGLLQGPYKHMLEKRNITEFANSAPNLYRNYFSDGRAAATVTDQERTVELVLEDIGPSYRSTYMEYAIMGYFERGLELLSGQRVSRRCVDGFARGNSRVCYRFRIG